MRLAEFVLLGVGLRALSEAGRPREWRTPRRTLPDDDQVLVLEVLDPEEEARPRIELDRECLPLFEWYVTDLALFAVALSWQSLRSFSIANLR